MIRDLSMIPCLIALATIHMHAHTHAYIGIARGGHGRAYALPSLNFALPSNLPSILKFNALYIEEPTWTYSISMASTRPKV